MIAEFADGLAGRLVFDPALARRVREEVEDHLREAVASDPSGGAEAERRAIARFGDPRAVAAQFAGAAVSRHAMQAGLGVVLVLACLFLAMQMRLAWYEFTEWGVCEAQAALGELVGTVDRSSFFLALAAGAAAWACAKRGAPLSLFRVLCLIAGAGIATSVACDAVLTGLRLAGWDFSADFLVPLGSMALEIACAGALLLQLHTTWRRTALASSAFPEIR